MSLRPEAAGAGLPDVLSLRPLAGEVEILHDVVQLGLVTDALLIIELHAGSVEDGPAFLVVEVRPKACWTVQEPLSAPYDSDGHDQHRISRVRA